MWSNNPHSAHFHREEDSDPSQLSPCLTASSGLYISPRSYNINARRGSTASLSPLGPTAPVYGKTPFSDHAFANFRKMGSFHEQWIDPRTVSYPFKAPGQEDHGHDGRTYLAPPTCLDRTLSMSLSGSSVTHQRMLMRAFTGVDTQASSAPVSCNTTFSSSPYAYYFGQLHGEPEHV